MTLIVGYAPDEQGRAGLHLGALLARSGGDRLVVCSVVPSPWVPGMARVDAEYRSYLDATADEALERARANLPAGVETTLVRHSARSAAVGLLELAAEHEASIVAGQVCPVTCSRIAARPASWPSNFVYGWAATATTVVRM